MRIQILSQNLPPNVPEGPVLRKGPDRARRSLQICFLRIPRKLDMHNLFNGTIDGIPWSICYPSAERIREVALAELKNKSTIDKIADYLGVATCLLPLRTGRPLSLFHPPHVLQKETESAESREAILRVAISAVVGLVHDVRGKVTEYVRNPHLPCPFALRRSPTHPAWLFHLFHGPSDQGPHLQGSCQICCHFLLVQQRGSSRGHRHSDGVHLCSRTSLH